MTESGFRKLWIAGIFVVAAAIVISSLVPRPLVPNQTGGDKVLHFVAYFVLALLASGIVTRERLPLAMLRCFLLGLALEAAQALLTAHRMAEWTDLVANGSGVLLAWLAAAGGRAGWAPRAASRMLRRRES